MSENLSYSFDPSDKSSLIGSTNSQVYKTASGVDPYQVQKANIKKTFWDRLANTFGLRSSYDKQIQDLDLQSNLRQDQLNMLEDEAKYNSEAEKTERMREAGLNPDLQGIGDASESGEYNEPESTPSSFQYEDSASQIASAFKGVIDLGLGLFTGFQNVHGLILDNSLKAASRVSSMTDLAKKIVDNSITAPGIETDESGSWKAYIGDEAYDSLVSRLGSDHVRYSVPQFMLPDIEFASKRDQKVFDKVLGQYKRSIFADGKRYKEYFDFLQSRKKSALASSSPFASPSYGQLEEVFRPISKLMFDIDKLSLEYDKIAKENAKKYEETYQDQNGAFSAASNDVLANLSSAQLNDYNQSVNKAWNDAMQSIEKYSKDHPVVGMIGIVLLNFLRSNMPMPKIDMSKKNTFVTNNTDNRSFDTNNVDKVVNVNN